MPNNKYHLAYARKQKNNDLVSTIQNGIATDQANDPKRRRWRNFQESIRTARKAGNIEMENRIRDHFARANGVK